MYACLMKNRELKYRIYPDRKQQEIFEKTFGCCRFVYNQMLTVQEELHKEGKKHLSKFDSFKYMTVHLKSSYEWLREVDSQALMNAVFDLEKGYQRFFSGKGGHPVYKSKRHGRRSFTTGIVNGNIAVCDDAIKLPKSGLVRARIHRPVPEGWKLKSATVSEESEGTFYCSLLYEIEEAAKTEETADASVMIQKGVTEAGDESIRALGLDYKSDGLYADSEGNLCHAPKYYRDSQRKLARLQRKASKKQGSRRGENASSNYRKALRKVSKLQHHTANQRKDFLHKESLRIANSVDIVCVEDLDMRKMSRRSKKIRNGKATLDNGYGMFLAFLSYKLEDRGKKLVKVDRWYPSSQICSSCGKRKKITLTERTYKCSSCGKETDRDINAAVNIRNEGIRLLRGA